MPRLAADASLAALAGHGAAVRAFDINRRRNDVATLYGCTTAALETAEGAQAFVPGNQLAGVEHAMSAGSDSQLMHGGAPA
jgi:hypothetical protein